MLSRESPAGSRLQIPFESERPRIVRECDIALEAPRAILSRVCDFACAALRQPRDQIICDPGIEMLRIPHTLENVDVFHREVRLRKEAPARQPSLDWYFNAFR